MILRTHVLFLLCAAAAAAPLQCPRGATSNDTWPTAADAARFLRVLEESKRAPDHHAYFAARGATPAEAQRRHGLEVLNREGDPRVLDVGLLGGRGVALLVAGEARFVASDAYVASLARVATAAGALTEVVAVMASESNHKGCQRRTVYIKEAAARAALWRGVDPARVHVRWYTNMSAFDADVIKALRVLAPPLGYSGVDVTAATMLTNDGRHEIRQYGKLLLAYDDMRTAETKRGRPFSSIAFLRLDTIYGGFDAAKVDAWTAHVVNDQFAAVGRPLARVYLAQLATIVKMFEARANACGRVNALLAAIAPNWGWDALFRGASLHLASYGVVHSGLDPGLNRLPKKRAPKPISWHEILRLSSDGVSPCLNHLIGKGAAEDVRGAEKFAKGLGLPKGALRCGCPGDVTLLAAPPVKSRVHPKRARYAALDAPNNL